MVVYSILEANFQDKNDLESISCLGTFITKKKAIKQLKANKLALMNDKSYPDSFFDKYTIENEEKFTFVALNKIDIGFNQCRIVQWIEENQLSL